MIFEWNTSGKNKHIELEIFEVVTSTRCIISVKIDGALFCEKAEAIISFVLKYPYRAYLKFESISHGTVMLGICDKEPEWEHDDDYEEFMHFNRRIPDYLYSEICKIGKSNTCLFYFTSISR